MERFVIDFLFFDYFNIGFNKKSIFKYLPRSPVRFNNPHIYE